MTLLLLLLFLNYSDVINAIPQSYAHRDVINSYKPLTKAMAID